MKRLERDRTHVESKAGIRKIVLSDKFNIWRGVTTYLGKTGGYSCGGRSPPSRSVGWTRDQIRNHQLVREHKGPGETALSKMECEENLILGTMDKSEIQVLNGVDRLHGLILCIQEGSADGDTKGALTKQEGIMMSSKQWIQRGVLCGLLLTGVVGCSMVSHPSVSQIAPTDNAALAAWYDKEAAQFRLKAKDMEEMKARYLKYPALIPIEGKHAAKTDVQQHCSNLISLYTKAAEEADEFAQMHRGMVK